MGNFFVLSLIVKADKTDLSNFLQYSTDPFKNTPLTLNSTFNLFTKIFQFNLIRFYSCVQVGNGTTAIFSGWLSSLGAFHRKLCRQSVLPPKCRTVLSMTNKITSLQLPHCHHIDYIHVVDSRIMIVGPHHVQH